MAIKQISDKDFATVVLQKLSAFFLYLCVLFAFDRDHKGALGLGHLEFGDLRLAELEPLC